MTENQCLVRIYRQITETGVTFHKLFIILKQNVMLNNFQHQQCSRERPLFELSCTQTDRHTDRKTDGQTETIYSVSSLAQA